MTLHYKMHVLILKIMLVILAIYLMKNVCMLVVVGATTQQKKLDPLLNLFNHFTMQVDL